MDIYDLRTHEGKKRGKVVEMTTQAERNRYHSSHQDPCGSSCYATQGVTPPQPTEGDY